MAKRGMLPLVLMLGMCGASAEELSSDSLLQRYGVQPDELPATTVVEPVENTPRFNIQPESPPVTFGSTDTPLEKTGNPSIDAMQERDRRLCQDLKQRSIEKNGYSRLTCP